MDINDRVIAAVQAYAETVPNPDFKLNLLAAAEHMAPTLIEQLALKQEWALIGAEVYDGKESIDQVRYESDGSELPFNELEYRRDQGYAYTDGDNYRDYVGTRLYTEWDEVHPIVLNADEQLQMDIDQESVV